MKDINVITFLVAIILAVVTATVSVAVDFLPLMILSVLYIIKAVKVFKKMS